MDDDDGLLALAPQWLKAGKAPGASGGSLQGVLVVIQLLMSEATAHTFNNHLFTVLLCLPA